MFVSVSASFNAEFISFHEIFLFSFMQWRWFFFTFTGLFQQTSSQKALKITVYIRLQKWTHIYAAKLPFLMTKNKTCLYFQRMWLKSSFSFIQTSLLWSNSSDPATAQGFIFKVVITSFNWNSQNVGSCFVEKLLLASTAARCFLYLVDSFAHILWRFGSLIFANSLKSPA